MQMHNKFPSPFHPRKQLKLVPIHDADGHLAIQFRGQELKPSGEALTDHIICTLAVPNEKLDGVFYEARLHNFMFELSDIVTHATKQGYNYARNDLRNWLHSDSVSFGSFT